MAKVLLIDDDELVVYALTRYLNRHGHEVVALNDGLRAEQRVATEQPDIVVTDLIMPEVDGLAVIMKLAASAPDLPIIAMSGGGRLVDSGYLDVAAKMGAKATLEKPFDEAELLQLIDQYTG